MIYIGNIAKSKELPKPKTPTELNDYRNSRRSTTKCPNKEPMLNGNKSGTFSL